MRFLSSTRSSDRTGGYKLFHGVADAETNQGSNGKPRKENKKLDENGNAIPSDKPKNKRGRGYEKDAGCRGEGAEFKTGIRASYASE